MMQFLPLNSIGRGRPDYSPGNVFRTEARRQSIAAVPMPVPRVIIAKSLQPRPAPAYRFARASFSIFIGNEHSRWHKPTKSTPGASSHFLGLERIRIRTESTAASADGQPRAVPRRQAGRAQQLAER
jgi:hypothetical protein